MRGGMAAMLEDTSSCPITCTCFALRIHNAASLSDFVGAWKRWSSRRISKMPRTTSTATGAIWQREFFDHLLRSEESYDQKWNYVRDNPVRANLAQSAAEWPFAGEIEALRF